MNVFHKMINAQLIKFNPLGPFIEIIQYGYYLELDGFIVLKHIFNNILVNVDFNVNYYFKFKIA